MDFGGLPVGEEERVVVAHRAELRGAVDLVAVRAADDVGVEEAAGHFAFEEDVVGAWRDDDLGADRTSAVCLDGRRRDAVAVGAEGEENATAAAFRAEVDGALNGLRIVGDAVRLGAEIHDVESER